ncbi:hypothetical protein NPIL_704411 [Nephila pilipes]|uniref:Uncharacterized protein n=1 Tax=Nephila pilipes TaxID=299642 RepID=A0A8X6NKH6_NEPPI|nr:hypothetical protein NPIL_704411 [Nephila pilipes]
MDDIPFRNCKGSCDLHWTIRHRLSALLLPFTTFELDDSWGFGAVIGLRDSTYCDRESQTEGICHISVQDPSSICWVKNDSLVTGSQLFSSFRMKLSVDICTVNLCNFLSYSCPVSV